MGEGRRGGVEEPGNGRGSKKRKLVEGMREVVKQRGLTFRREIRVIGKCVCVCVCVFS